MCKLSANQDAAWFTWQKGTVRPACMEQAMPSLTSPRVHQLPKGAGARLTGLNKRFLGDLTLDESVYSAVLHRPQPRPGSPKQAQTWPDGSIYSIVQEAPTFAEIGPMYFGL